MLLAKEGERNVIEIAYLNNFELRFFKQHEFTDGTKQILLEGTNWPKQIFLYYSFKKPFDSDALNLLRILSFFKDHDVVIVAPFFPFLREELEKNCTSSMSLFEKYKIITLDSHVKFDNVYSVAPDFFKKFIKEDDVLVFPDAGAEKRYANLFENQKVFGRKCRKAGVEILSKENISGKDCIIIDDIIESGFTLSSTIAQLRILGAKSVQAYITHYLAKEFQDWGLDYFLTSDTLIKEVYANVCECAGAFHSLRRKASELK